MLLSLLLIILNEISNNTFKCQFTFQSKGKEHRERKEIEKEKRNSLVSNENY